MAMCTLHLPAQALDLPAALNFDGQLLDSTDNPITTTSTVVFEIYDPSGNCLLYNETQSITPNADGSFTTKIGPSTGNASSPNDGDISWNMIFQNDGQVRASSAFCAGGYTPAVNHGRNLRVTINGTVLTPDYSLSPVPMATVAETLQGKRVSDFLLASPTSGISAIDADFRIANNQQLQLGSGSPSTNYVNIMAPAAIGASYTLTLPPDDGVANQVLQTDGNGVLTWATSGGGGGTVTSITAGAGLDGGTITTTGAISIATGGVTNTHLATGIDASKLTVGTVPAAAINAIVSSQITDGTIATADIAASSINSGHIIDGTIVDADIASLSATKLIGGGCAANQILKWNGSNWACSVDIGAVIGNANGTAMAADAVPNCTPGNKLQMSGGPVYTWSCVRAVGQPLGASVGQTGQIGLQELVANGGNEVIIRAPDALPIDYGLTLPTSAGANGQVLRTDGTGVLSWVDALLVDSTVYAFSGNSVAPGLTFANDDDTGFFNDAPNTLSTTVGGVELMRMTTAAVGIGTTNPVDRFIVRGGNGRLTLSNNSTNATLAVKAHGTGATPIINLSRARGTDISSTPPMANDVLGKIFFSSPDNAAIGSSITSMATQNHSGGLAGADLTFSTVPNSTAAPVIRMLIADNGNVGVGTTTPSATMHINGLLKLEPSSAGAGGPTSCAGNPGLLAFNATVGMLCVCNGTAWLSAAGASCGVW